MGLSLHHAGGAVDPLSQLIWRALFYMAVAVFLATGVLKSLPAHAVTWSCTEGGASHSGGDALSACNAGLSGVLGPVYMNGVAEFPPYTNVLGACSAYGSGVLCYVTLKASDGSTFSQFTSSTTTGCAYSNQNAPGFCVPPTCSGSQQAQNGVCGCPAAGTASGDPGSVYPGMTSSPSTICYEGCVASVGFSACWPAGGTGVYASAGCELSAGNFTGSSNCTGLGNAPGSGGAPTCPLGQVMGQINGMNACLPVGSVGGNTSTSSSTTGTNSSGGTVTDTTTTSTTGNGSTTTTTTTVIGSGNAPANGTGCVASATVTCSQTSTGPVSGGVVGGTGSAAGSSFCQENPGMDICKTSSWGGACGSGFSCTGNAVECAVAQQQYTEACKLTDTPTNNGGSDSDALTYLGGLSGDQTSAGASSPVRTAIKANQEKVDASTVTFDQTSFYGGGACPSPSISFGSFTATVPGMSLLCSNIGYLGAVLIGLTSIVCFLIYARILGGVATA